MTHPLPSIVLVCADTHRAKAYAEALSTLQARNVEIVCYASPPPDTPISSIAARMGWLYNASDATRISQLGSAKSRATLSLFAGLPGEIVPSETLDAWPPMLHFHAGDLPAYRGSTTLFYALLQGQPITVSALILSSEIDAGPVLLKKQFAKPENVELLDGPYDSYIRSETLVELLNFWRSNGRLPRCLQFNETHSSMHFIIHPVLKHLAMLRSHPKETDRS